MLRTAYVVNALLGFNRSDVAERLTPHIDMSREQTVAYWDNDELLDVTPAAIQLRQRNLDPRERKHQVRAPR